MLLLTFVPCVCAYVGVLIATSVPVCAGTVNAYANWTSSLLFTMVLISLQVRETVRSRALFLCSFVFSQGVFCNSLPSPWALQPHHPRGGFLASLVARLHESRVTRLLHVRCACFRSTPSVHAGCGLEPVFIGTIHVRDAPDEEHLRRRRTRSRLRGGRR